MLLFSLFLYVDYVIIFLDLVMIKNEKRNSYDDITSAFIAGWFPITCKGC